MFFKGSYTASPLAAAAWQTRSLSDEISDAGAQEIYNAVLIIQLQFRLFRQRRMAGLGPIPPASRGTLQETPADLALARDAARVGQLKRQSAITLDEIQTVA